MYQSEDYLCAESAFRRLSNSTVVKILVAIRVAGGTDAAGLMEFTGLGKGTAYPYLMKLIEAGFVKAEAPCQRVGKGGRPRLVYTLTEVGRGAADFAVSIMDRG